MRQPKGRGMHMQIKTERTWDGVMRCGNCNSTHPGKMTIKYTHTKCEDGTMRAKQIEYCTKCEGKSQAEIDKMIRSNKRKEGKR